MSAQRCHERCANANERGGKLAGSVLLVESLAELLDRAHVRHEIVLAMSTQGEGMP